MPALHSPNARRRGTTLIEVLVVIVVFLIGILAVAQIFPGGFRVLTGTRNRSLATTLARSEAERLKARPDLLPASIIPVRYENSGGTIVALVDSQKSPRDFAPSAVGINSAGLAVDGSGTILGDWARLSGPNTIRRVLGEAHEIPSPRYLSAFPSASSPYGSLLTLQYGPIDYNSAAGSAQFAVYGRDMLRRIGAAPSVPADAPREYEFVLTDAASPAATISFPARLNAEYRIALTVYLNDGTATVRRDIVDVPAIPIAITANGFATVPVSAIPGIIPAGFTLVAVDPDSVHLARNFRQLALADPFSTTDPYEFKLINPALGVLLFNGLGYNRFETRPGEARTPLVARINYDVYDWRILHEDFRIDRGQFIPAAAQTDSTFRLPVNPIRTASDVRADGRRGYTPSGGDLESIMLQPINGYTPAVTSATGLENFILLDLETGGIFCEFRNGQRYMELNKSTGRLRFESPGTTTTGWLYLPDGTFQQTPIENRSVRAYYVARDEWAVQVLRAPALYTLFVAPNAVQPPPVGTYYIGGTGPLSGLGTRLYFPRMDAGRKVSIGRFDYNDNNGFRKSYEGGDFVLRYDSSNAETIVPEPLPYIDIRDVAPDAISFNFASGNPVTSVRGASAVVRVFFNEQKFSLPPTTLNLTQSGNAFDRYLRQWKVDTKETFLTDTRGVK